MTTQNSGARSVASVKMGNPSLVFSRCFLRLLADLHQCTDGPSSATSDEKRPGRGRQRINPREFVTTGPRTPETAANYLLHRGLRQDGSGDQRGVSARGCRFPSRPSTRPCHDAAPSRQLRPYGFAYRRFHSNFMPIKRMLKRFGK